MFEAGTALSVSDLTCIFGMNQNAVYAVSSVNFEVFSDEIVTIVGESGSGKSTIAKMLLQLQKPSNGDILYWGEPAEDIFSFYRNVQAVFQDPFASFNQFFTVKTLMNDCFNILDEKYSEAERLEIITQALKSVKLEPEKLLEKYPFELSGGEMQRLLIARIFIIKPRILIADEPTSMIDASLRAQILDLLLELKREMKMSIVFITHDIGLAYYVSDRIFVMNKGQIVETGRPEAVIRTPKHPYTKKLLSDLPILDKEWISF